MIVRFCLFGITAFVAPCLAAPGSLLLRPVGDPAIEMWTQTVTAARRALKTQHVDQAVELAEAAITQARSFGPSDTHVVQAMVVRAEIYLWQKDYGHAESTFQEAIRSCEQAVGPNAPVLVHPLSSLANFYYYVQPHYDRVAALSERILGIVDHAEPRRDEDVILWSRNLGAIYQKMGDYERAEPLFARAVALTAKVQPQWQSHEELTQAGFYRSWKKYDRAVEIARLAVERREQALRAAPENIDRKLDVAVALNELGTIELESGQLAEAEDSARRSLGFVEAIGEPNNPELGPRLSLLADVLHARAQYEEAAAVYRRLTDLTEKNLGPESQPLAEVLTRYATVLRELKRDGEAAPIQAKAESMRRKFTAAVAP
jgi:tetratricopeptide (TPR) repeat protein